MKLFSFMRKKEYLSHQKEGVLATISTGKPIFISWNAIKKVVLAGAFEEYSGYFLTDDYLSKKIYDDMSIDCRENVVRIRTGSSPIIKKNLSKPFSRKFGVTSIYHVVFIEYVDNRGHKNLYAAHYANEQKKELIKVLNLYVSPDKIYVKKILEGFDPLSKL